MKIAYVTNFLNHHTRFLAEELYAQLKGDFVFIETEPHGNQEGLNTEEKNFKLGYSYFWAGGNETPPWCLQAYKKDQEEKCRVLVNESDAVIIANASDSWIAQRLKENKLTFRAHERWYKKGLPWYRLPKSCIGGWLHHGRHKSLYLLSASAYTAADAKKVGCFSSKAFRWGYFPEFCKYSSEELKRLKNNVVPQILWTGRMIDWKHAEDALTACAGLKKKGYQFILTFIGSGPEESFLKKLCRELGLEDRVRFLGALQPNEVRAHMEKSNIYLLTSDFQEGWGVVLNEAMNSGCAVVASHAAGATPYLIENHTNGIIYQSGAVEELEEAIEFLLDNPQKRELYGQKAYETICDFWSPEKGALRLIELSERLLGLSEGALPAKGPCSLAPVLRNNWFENK